MSIMSPRRRPHAANTQVQARALTESAQKKISFYAVRQVQRTRSGEAAFSSGEL